MLLAYYDVIALSILAIFFVLYFLVKVDSRLILIVAMLLVAGAGAALALDAAGLANEIAIISFYCLTAGVMLILVENLMWPTKGPLEARPFFGRAAPFLERIAPWHKS